MRAYLLPFLIVVSAPALAQEPSPAVTPTGPTVTLQDAMSLAMQHSFTTLVANYRQVSAAEAVGVTKVGFLPSLSATIQDSALQQHANDKSPVGAALGNSYGQQRQGSLDARYELFSTTRRLDYRSASLSLSSQTQQAELARRQVRRDVANAYLTVVQDDQLLRLADADVVRKTRSLDEARAMVKAGKRAEFEVVRAEADLASAQATEVGARNDARLSRQALAQVVGFDLPIDLAVTPPSVPPDPRGSPAGPGISDAQIDDVLRHRPDVLSSSTDAEVASVQLQKTRRRYLPTLSLFGDYTQVIEPTRTDFFDRTVSYGGQLVVRFDDTAANVYRTGQARADAQGAAVKAEQTRIGARLDIRRAALEVDRATEVRDATAKALDASRRNYDSVDERYRLGVASQTERVDAEQALVSAEVDAEKADVGLQTALWNLRYEMGASLEP